MRDGCVRLRTLDAVAPIGLRCSRLEFQHVLMHSNRFTLTNRRDALNSVKLAKSFHAKSRASIASAARTLSGNILTRVVRNARHRNNSGHS